MPFGRYGLGPGARLLSTIFELLCFAVVVTSGPEWTEAVWLHDIPIFQSRLPYNCTVCILSMNAIGVEEDALPAAF